jgi:hypothetical protein
MFSFAAPLALVGLIGLPLIYWLLRVTPPRPREIVFPPTKILRELKPDEETPAKTPWWLMALRLALAAALILAMAGPVWAPSGVVASSASMLIVIDDGWPAAPTWERRVAGAASIIESAARAGGPVAVALASETAAPVPGDGGRAMEKLRSARPKPFLPDRKAIGEQAAAFARAHPGARIVWISDGIAQGDAAGFARALKEAGASSVEVYVEDHAPRALAAPTNDAAALSVDVLRTGDDASAVIDALDAKGRTIGRTTADFNGAPRVRAKIELPVELRNEVSHLRIEGENSAGAVALLDARSKVKRVALVGGESADQAQPLLSPLYYLEKALAPFAQIRVARPGVVDPVQALLAENPNIMALADVGLAPGETFDALSRFVEEGGTLVRFAGPRLANADDELLPVRLRRNGRVLGGAMSWEEPKSLAEFDAASPFFGLPAAKDVTVQRQVLAEPDPGLADKTWARLSDGTPLVTAERRGKGLIVLFHVNADANWSNLPISGLFVEMLKRISAMAGESAPSGGEQSNMVAEQSALAPMRILDGFGGLGAPGPTAQSIPPGFEGPASAEHPPGLYGAGEAFVSVQTLRPTDEISAFNFAGAGLSATALRSGSQLDLRGPLLAFALIAFIADALIAMALAGKLRLRPFGAATAALLALLCMSAATDETRAESAPKSAATQRDKDVALTTRLAYVVSGDAHIDETSRLGLEALTQALNMRTSFSPGDPVGVDPAKDELAFYPMLYWPIVASAPQPSTKTVAKVAAYMKQGGTVVFDTRDALSQRIGGAPTPETQWLRDLTKGLDIPPLEVTPRDHVITKTFYLLDGFVGRYANGETWVEALPPEPKDQAARPVRATDSVSAIVITSNDLAAAWAQDKRGQPLFPLTPGGARQRELALRGGINLVMYTLTGNYKSDQVHVRDLLERLGQ